MIISIYYFMKNNNVENKPTENNNILKEEDTSFFPMIQIIENNDIVPSSKNLISNENITKALKTMDNAAPNTKSIAKNVTNSKKFDGKVLFSADIKEADKNY